MILISNLTLLQRESFQHVVRNLLASSTWLFSSCKMQQTHELLHAAQKFKIKTLASVDQQSKKYQFLTDPNQDARGTSYWSQIDRIFLFNFSIYHHSHSRTQKKREGKQHQISHWTIITIPAMPIIIIFFMKKKKKKTATCLQSLRYSFFNLRRKPTKGLAQLTKKKLQLISK